MYIRKLNKGFTLIEVLVAFVCVIIVILGTVATLTMTTKYSNLEKAETVAQNIAKNIMTQKIKNASFDSVKNSLTGTPLSQTTITLFDSKTPNTSSLGSSDTLRKDLRLLGNSKCNLVLTPLDAGPKQINSKVEVWWNLDSNGNANSKSRKFELSSIVYEFNYNDTSKPREKLASKVDLSVLPGTCPVLNKPNNCTCGNNGECASGNCVGGICVATAPQITNLPKGASCSSDSQCASGNCKNNGTCN